MSGLAIVFINLIIFGSIASLFLVPRYFKNREREKVQDTIRAAIDKGQPLPPEFIEAMTKDIRPASSAQRDIRVGVIWLAIAAAFGGFAWFLYQFNDTAAQVFVAMGALPATIGVAFILLSFFNKTKA